jgi:ligand-binding sensor domain-containing protein/two-component sensor histidine kinase
MARGVMLFVSLLLLMTINAYAQNYLLQKLPLFPDKQDILVNALTKDRLGFIWFIHNSEIYRYDGYRSLNISQTIQEYALLNDTPQKIVVDTQNRLWIAGQQRLSYLDLTTWQIHHIKNEVFAELNDKTVVWMKEMANGAIMIAYQNGYLGLYHHNKWTLNKSLYEKTITSNSAIIAQSCTFWKGQYQIGTSAGTLLSIDPTNENATSYIEFPTIQHAITNLIALDNLLLIDVANQGLLTLHENGQLSEKKIKGMKFRADIKHVFQEGTIHHVYADTEHIYIIDQTLKVLQEIDITIGHQYALVDKDEIILAADDGIHILFEKPAGVSELVSCNTNRRKSVRGIHVFKDGGIFLGSYGGASYLDSSGSCHPMDSIKTAYCILPIDETQLLIGTEGGFLKVFDRRSLTISNYPFTLSDQVENKFNFPSSILSLAETPQHYLIGSTKGLWNIDKNTHLLTPIKIQLQGQKLLNLQIRHIVSLTNEWLLSTQIGLLKLTKEGQATRLFPTQGSIGVYKTVHHQDTLWLATQGKGLVAIDQNGSLLKNWTQSEGLSANTVFSLEIIEGLKLAGTSDGLSLLENGLIRRISEKEGLLHPEFNAAASFWDQPRGRVFMGGIKGYTILEVAKLQIQSRPVESYITELHITSSSHPFIKKDFTRPYTNKDIIELQADESIVGLYLGSPAHYRSKIHINYSLKETNWQHLPASQFISFIELSPGSYPIEFETIGTGLNVNRSMVWIRKLPNFYETWWFTLLLILIAITIVAIWYRAKFHKIRREQQIRNRIAEDLHDEVGGLLTGISMQVELLRMKDQHPANQRNITQLSSLSKEVLQSMNDVVWSLNSRNDSWNNLLDKLTDFGKQLFEASKTQFAMHTIGTIPDKLSQQERQTVYLLIRESLNNACKHANATKVELTFHFRKQIIITITDNGHGFTTTTRYHGNGIKNMKNRARTIEGNLEILSNSEGTKIQLQYAPKN